MSQELSPFVGFCQRDETPIPHLVQDWFIAVPAKITSSGHQIELKMCEHHFYKVDWEELDRLIEAA